MDKTKMKRAKLTAAAVAVVAAALIFPGGSLGQGLAEPNLVLGRDIVVDAMFLFQNFANIVMSNDDFYLHVYLENRGAVAGLDVAGTLTAPPGLGISVTEGVSPYGDIGTAAQRMGQFRVLTNETPPGIYPLELVVSGLNAAPKSLIVPIYVVDIGVPAYTEGPDGLPTSMTIVIYSPDGTLEVVETFQAGGTALPTVASFTPPAPFAGVHEASPVDGDGGGSTVTKKLLAGLGSFLGIGTATIVEGLRTAGMTIGLAQLLLDTIGWKALLKQVAIRLTPGLGWIALILGACAGVANAIAAGDAVQGDVFWRGEGLTPAPALHPGELTTSERVDFDVDFTNAHDTCATPELEWAGFPQSLESAGLEGPIVLAGTAQFTRTTTQGSYGALEVLAEATSWFFVPIAEAAGPGLPVTGRFVRGDGDVSTGSDVWAHGAVVTTGGDLSFVMRDDGAAPDALAGDGLYAGTVPLPTVPPPWHIAVGAEDMDRRVPLYPGSAVAWQLA